MDKKFQRDGSFTPSLSPVEEAAIKLFAQNVGVQLGKFVTTALAETLTMIVALRKPVSNNQFNQKTKPNPPFNQLLTAEEVALRLNISKAKTYQMIQAGEIPALHMGRTTRVRQADLEEFICGHI